MDAVLHHDVTHVSEALKDRQTVVGMLRERIQRRAREAEIRSRTRIPGPWTPEPILRHRYREVLAGFELVSSGEQIQSQLIAFEEALLDLEVCAGCKAVDVEVLGKDESSDWRQYVVADCPLAAHGHGSHYYALSPATYTEKRPVFAYYNCGGPVERMRQLAARLEWKGGAEE